MKLKEVFEKSVQFFKDKKMDTPRLEAELLISHVLKLDRLQIYLKYEQPLSENEIQACRDVIRRRVQGEPVAYIIKEKGFFAEVFAVGEGVLIPRPETELIVEEALKFITENKIEAPKVLDLGAGTGCIGFSILKNCPQAQLVSVEKYEKAYEYLKINQQKLELQDRSELILGDVIAQNFTDKKFDIIVANPPYIAKNDAQVEPNVKKFEPESALFAEQEGYSDLLAWSDKFRSVLSQSGIMLFEMGYQQGNRLQQHFEGFQQFKEIKVLKDLSGLDRVVKALNN